MNEYSLEDGLSAVPLGQDEVVNILVFKEWVVVIFVAHLIQHVNLLFVVILVVVGASARRVADVRLENACPWTRLHVAASVLGFETHFESSLY